MVLAAILAVLAVPPARTAIFDWLGIGGARIVRVDDLPPLPPVQDLDVLGQRATLAEARARAGFPFADPPRDEPAPDEVRLAPGLRVSYVWRDGKDVRLLVTQFPGDVGDPGLLKKLAGQETIVDRFELDGNPAVWLEGGPHVVLFVAPDGRISEDQAGSPATRCSSTGMGRPSASREHSTGAMRSTSFARCPRIPRPRDRGTKARGYPVRGTDP